MTRIYDVLVVHDQIDGKGVQRRNIDIKAVAVMGNHSVSSHEEEYCSSLG